ncbi:DUF1353 domain-containing protein [Abyssibius alkaniclasticus]|uniref:DUF1353 domain-containing protein n=1 Tax=Abyssibius alkaniclasticus TaxID=2881234 RepID=UPI0023635DFC|nr:DUF1353 domain-containing protein [Abyssibius alkaniclasticus]UPH70567.1 DUF1353 domain-containing protein [Abyssibius alkaniclasticus]|tara:strand:+ start:622 stop:1188 length:567 start_codon:yes stop_codon:yes gene_type:complete
MVNFSHPISVFAMSYKMRGTAQESLWWQLLPPAWRAERWIVAYPLVYNVHSDATAQEQITVPSGFMFDGASIPPGITLLLPRSHPVYMAAAALHDWLYVDVVWSGTRRQADRIFFDAMRELNTPKPWAWAMWLAVRAFGGFYWWPRRLRVRRGQPYDVADQIIDLAAYMKVDDVGPIDAAPRISARKE